MEILKSRFKEHILESLDHIIQQNDELLTRNRELSAQNDELLAKNDELSAALSNMFLSVDNKQAAVLYGYRYLLNRDPEDASIIQSNTKPWQTLRDELLESAEYQRIMISKDPAGASGGFSDVYTTQYRLQQLKESGILPDYESVLESMYKKLILPGNTVIDIGAHAGRHSEKFFELIGETGTLCAFEPLKKQYLALCDKFPYPNVRILNRALSDCAGTMDFFEVENYPEESGLKQRIYNNEDAVVTKTQVTVDVLDRYIDDFSRIDYIKLDAEGAELSILEGAKVCLGKFRPVVSIEFGYPSYSIYGVKAVDLYHFAESMDYYLADIYGNIIFDPNIWEELCDSVYWDYFLVPKEKLKDFLLRVHQ